jgi:hypothetical protein
MGRIRVGRRSWTENSLIDCGKFCPPNCTGHGFARHAGDAVLAVEDGPRRQRSSLPAQGFAILLMTAAPGPVLLKAVKERALGM